MEIITLIEEMEKMVESALHIPLTGKVFLDGDLLLDYLDRLRSILPEEIRQAQWIRQEKERLLEEARVKAQETVDEALKRTEMMVEEHEVVRKARANASEIMARTRSAADEIKAGAMSYADAVLARLEANLDQTLAKVRQNRQELHSFFPGGQAIEVAATSEEKASNLKAAGKGSGGLSNPAQPGIKR